MYTSLPRIFVNECGCLKTFYTEIFFVTFHSLCSIARCILTIEQKFFLLLELELRPMPGLPQLNLLFALTFG